MSDKKNTPQNSPLNKDLKDYEIKVNEFGEIKTNLDIDAINDFLNKNVEDKKLKDRDDV